MISLFAPWTWCSSDAESWVFTMMAYWVQGFRGRMRYPGSILSLSASEERCGGSTSAITQLLEPQASWPSNSVTFWKGLLKRPKKKIIKFAEIYDSWAESTFQWRCGDWWFTPIIYNVQPSIHFLQILSYELVGSNIIFPSNPHFSFEL